MPKVPIDALRTLTYQHLSTPTRALVAVGALDGAIASLSQSVAHRNAVIERLQQLGEQGLRKQPWLYLGTPYGEGHKNSEFADTIDGLHRLTDDVIFFSNLLMLDLREHGEALLEQYKKLAKIQGVKIVEMNFHDAEMKGLMPNPEAYRDWLAGFPPATQQRD